MSVFSICVPSPHAHSGNGWLSLERLKASPRSITGPQECENLYISISPLLLCVASCILLYLLQQCNCVWSSEAAGASTECTVLSQCPSLPHLQGRLSPRAVNNEPWNLYPNCHHHKRTPRTFNFSEIFIVSDPVMHTKITYFHHFDLENALRKINFGQNKH